MNQALFNYCLRLGDNNLVLGQRLAEWCSNGPILEEDLAMTNLSLDHFGQAEIIYGLAAELEGKNKTADELAFNRSEREYFNALMVEQPNGDFAFTIMRQFLFSAFAKQLYIGLCSSSNPKLVALAERGLKEIKYHLRHSSEWVIRFGLGTPESKARAQAALNELWPYTGSLFEKTSGEEELIAQKLVPDTAKFYEAWKKNVDEALHQANLNIPENAFMFSGGYNGMHTEHLGHLLCEMQFLQRAYPGAKWQ